MRILKRIIKRGAAEQSAKPELAHPNFWMYQ